MSFPAFEPVEQPAIVWDSSQGKFRDTATGRFVSNLSGAQTLRVSQAEGVVRFYDQAGRFAPDPATLIFGTQTFEYTNVTRRWSSFGAEVYDQKAPSNGYYVTMASYVDDKGNLKFVTVYNKIGERVNFDDEQRRIAQAIAKQEKIPLGKEGTKLILERATRLYHWLAK